MSGLLPEADNDTNRPDRRPRPAKAKAAAIVATSKSQAS